MRPSPERDNPLERDNPTSVGSAGAVWCERRSVRASAPSISPANLTVCFWILSTSPPPEWEAAHLSITGTLFAEYGDQVRVPGGASACHHRAPKKHVTKPVTHNMLNLYEGSRY